MSLARRQALIELCARYNTPILEDDFAGDLCYQGSPFPSLYTLAGLIGRSDLVIYQGTFSKALCPGVRLGWLAAPRSRHRKTFLCKRTRTLPQTVWPRSFSMSFCCVVSIKRHLLRVNAVYKSRLEAMISDPRKRIQKLSRRHISRPDGGLFLWLTLPEGLSNRELLNFADSEKVVFSPGDLCFSSDSGLNHLRLCFIQNDEIVTADGIARLARAYKKYLDYVRASAAQTSVKPRPANHVLI